MASRELARKNEALGARKMVQQLKCLPEKHEDLSSKPQNPHKCLVGVVASDWEAAQSKLASKLAIPGFE